MAIFEEILLCEKDMDMVQSILQEKLELSFEKHESDYWGIYFGLPVNNLTTNRFAVRLMTDREI